MAKYYKITILNLTREQAELISKGIVIKDNSKVAVVMEEQTFKVD